MLITEVKYNMLLKINRDMLLKPLMLITGFVEKKQSLPILSNIYIKKTGNTLVMIANDMEIQASITVNGEMIGEDFVLTLPAKKLQDILKSFSDSAQVTIEIEHSRVLIKSNRAKFILHSVSADHYPLIRINTELEGQFIVDQGLFKSLIGQVQYAMADKDTRVFLNGMLLEIKNHVLNLVATDAHRLSLVSTTLDGGSRDYNVIIPRKTIIELYRLLEENTKHPLIVKIFANQVHFETEDKQLTTKVIDGKYPDYERVIPLNNNNLCLINRELLLNAVERVSVIGIDKLKTINFELSNNKLDLSCINEESEESRDQIDIEYSSEQTLKLSFNVNFIRDLLSNTHAPSLQWAFFDSQRSVLVTIPNDPNFKAVVMPLRN